MVFIEELFKQMYDQKVILTYQGEFTQAITKSVLSMTEKNLDSMGEENVTKKKVFNVMVECLQNIVKHSQKGTNILDKAIFIIGQTEETYEIATGNFISNIEIASLTKKIEQVNNLDKIGLKELYKDLIKNKDGLSDKGGAGLGLVDIARKSGHQIEYLFNKHDDKNSFFSLQTSISRIK
jgi:hypothetical protein